jgi:hypothetical protein
MKGDKVKVVRGRKVPIGVEGVVIWSGSDNWGKARVGIKDAEGKVHFTAESNVEVTEKSEAREIAPAETRLFVRGMRVRVIASGNEGEIFWIGPDRYRPGAIRLGINVASGTCWAGSSEVELVAVQEVA